MKIKYLGLSVIALGMTLTSCDDFLDELPDNRMELSNVENIKDLLVSAYADVNPAYLAEMYSDNADLCQNPGWTEASRFQRQAFEWADITETGDPEAPQELWNGYYRAIASANAAIEYIDKLSADEQAEYAPYLGEALLCRAYNMFMLSTVFCHAYDPATADKNLGLPYPEHTETVVGQQYERGTLKDLYGKIDADLQRGLPLVKNVYSKPKFHFTQKAAYAFATRFYLNYQKYDESIRCANLVLGSSPQTDLRNWSALYSTVQNRQTAPEFFISSDHVCNLLLQVVQSEWGAIGGPYMYGDRYAHGDAISKNETLEAKYPWGTKTMNAYVWSNRSLSKYIFRKVPYEFEYTDLQAGIGYAHAEYAVLTTDIALLERAEANALAGNYEAALADLNTEFKVFLRGAGASYQATIEGLKQYYDGVEYYEPKAPTPKKKLTKLVTDTEKQEPLLQAILQLKRVMTLHEGFRLQDVKRYGIVIYRRIMNSNYDIVDVTDEMKADDPRLAIQLPQDVITAGLEANPRDNK